MLDKRSPDRSDHKRAYGDDYCETDLQAWRQAAQ